MSNIRRAMNIPKQHTLKHYMRLLGELYGEPKESLDTYVEEQLKANEEKLDEAIDCFDQLIKQAKFLEVNKAKK